MKQSFVSFDVFDTCLIRRCGRPEKIWDLMADSLFEKDDFRNRLSFIGNRSAIEEMLRDENPFPTLNDIYNSLNASQWGFDAEWMMQMEMEIEEKELFPNPSVLNRIKKFRKKGFHICFVSDMYLPSCFIKKILAKYDFFEDGDKVFVSAECKSSKFDGSLFDYVFKETKTKPKQWIHFGDNKESDYLVPKSKGMNAVWVSETDFSEIEKRWLDNAKFYAHKHEIELWTGLCRNVRMLLGNSERVERAVDLISSLYVPYVLYVLDMAQRKNIKKIFFLARDARIFLKIAGQFEIQYSGIELKYLNLSRRLLYPCVFYDLSEDEMELTIYQCGGLSAGKVLEYLGLDWNGLSISTKNAYRANRILSSKGELRAFAKILKDNDANELLKNAANKRKLLLEYLEQEGMLDGNKNATVDLGWIGSSRCILNYVLRKERYSASTSFYWGYGKRLLRGNVDDELFVFQHQYDLYQFTGAVWFAEYYASINEEGSTKSLKKELGKIVPVKGKTNFVDSDLVCCNEYSVETFAANLRNFQVDQDALYDIFLCCGLKSLQKMIEKPSSRDISFFSNIETENFGRVSKMTSPLKLKNIFSLLVWGVPAIPQWAAASVKRSFGPFSKLFVRLCAATAKSTFAHRLRLWWDVRK